MVKNKKELNLKIYFQFYLFSVFCKLKFKEKPECENFLWRLSYGLCINIKSRKDLSSTYSPIMHIVWK